MMSQDSRRDDFAGEKPCVESMLLVDKSRTYGRPSVLPSYLQRRILKVKEESAEVQNKKLRATALKLLHLKHSCKSENTAFLGGLKPHLKKLYEKKDWVFFHALLSGACENTHDEQIKLNKKEILSLTSRIGVGFETSGVIPRSGFWDHADDFRKKMDEQPPPTERIVVGKGKLPGRHFSTRRQRRDLKRQAQKWLDLGIWEVAKEGEVVDLPALAFPVEQGVRPDGTPKNRLCVDSRGKNLRQYPMDAVRLLGTRAAVEAYGRLASDKADASISVLVQGKRDVVQDVLLEKDFRTRVQSDLAVSLAANGVGRISKDANPDFAFIGRSAVRDMSGYYYQLGQDRVDCNVFALPEEVVGDPAGDDEPGAQATWTTIKSSCCLFGSLSSVWGALFVSEAVMLLMSECCGLLSLMYVDDIHLIARALCLKRSERLMDLVFFLIGLEVSDEKSKSTDIQEWLVVLGVSYRFPSHMDAVFLNTSEEKRMKGLLQVQDAFSALEAGNISVKMIQSLRGLYQFLTQFRPSSAGVAKCLDGWTDEEKFGLWIKNGKMRRCLAFGLEVMRKELEELEEVWITVAREQAAVVHLYSDASLSESGKAEIGAVLVGDHLERPVGWGFVVEKPDDFGIGGLDIGFFEAVAAQMAQQLADLSEDFHVFHHIDNLPDVYSITKGVSSSAATSSVIDVLRQDMKKRNSSIYYSWISTHRNVSDCYTRPEKLRLLKSWYDVDDWSSVFGVSPSSDDIPWSRIQKSFSKFNLLLPVRSQKKRRREKNGRKLECGD